MSAVTNLTSIFNQLEQERRRLTSQLERLNGALAALNGTGKIGTPGKSPLPVARGAPPLNVLAGLKLCDRMSSLLLPANARCPCRPERKSLLHRKQLGEVEEIAKGGLKRQRDDHCS